ncbi:hypothetical protein Hanom_Chr04g00375941 [Helianthus anomalus]
MQIGPNPTRRLPGPPTRQTSSNLTPPTTTHRRTFCRRPRTSRTPAVTSPKPGFRNQLDPTRRLYLFFPSNRRFSSMRKLSR